MNTIFCKIHAALLLIQPIQHFNSKLIGTGKVHHQYPFWKTICFPTILLGIVPTYLLLQQYTIL